MTLEELVAIAPEIQRYLRAKVTPRRIAVNETETVALTEVLKYRVAPTDEENWNPDLVTGVPALPLRYLDCHIGKFEVEGVLDTGAQLVIISKRLWVELGRPIDANFPRITMQSANATKDRTIGLCANLEVKIFDIPFYLQAHVVEEAPFDLLLGRPFFALAQSEETSLPDGETVIVLKDPNSGVVLKVPTKARATRRHRHADHGERDDSKKHF
ncbi:hypothetical protein AURDEDRAFT_62382 [Auricularia subglabra TFB-10046 SS5]|nr:hypothetical protein AURDEDRAFT_62382 [Auricularia subglabra TFB-10046 SS5]